ncbi:MAG: P1 family peptidase [Phycisphaerales bacterium]
MRHFLELSVVAASILVIAGTGSGAFMSGYESSSSGRVEPSSEGGRARARDLGIMIGDLEPGPLNAITDVAGVGVGHETIVEGDSIRTGVTVIVPRLGENSYARKVPGAVAVGNGFGKAAGFTQVEELGTIEAPIVLTNTLAVGAALDGMTREMLALAGNEEVRSINVVVGETNDGHLNDIRAMVVTREHVARAFANASGGAVEEGCVGAGTGTICFGFKGGIGTSSRVVELPGDLGSFTVGALVQTNYGGRLRVDGVKWSDLSAGEDDAETGGDGSCMIVIATDAPLDARQLGRVARRALLALPRTGSVMSHGSGDYAIAFSNFEGNVVTAGGRELRHAPTLPDAALTKLFVATIDATEEAILNSMFMAETTRGRDGHVVEAIDLEPIRTRFGAGR